MEITPTRLKFPLTCVRTQHVVSRVRMSHNIHWFAYKIGLGTELIM